MLETQIRVRERERDTGRLCAAGFVDGGRDREPGDAAALEAGKGKLTASWAFGKNSALLTHCRLLIPRTTRQ